MLILIAECLHLQPRRWSASVLEIPNLYGGTNAYKSEILTRRNFSEPIASDIYDKLDDHHNDDSKSREENWTIEEIYENNVIENPYQRIPSERQIDIHPLVYDHQYPQQSIINVKGGEKPLKVIFRSHSSPMVVKQIHKPWRPHSMEQTNSQDAPTKVMHAVMRPVIQEVREIIQPYRKVTQEIRPVLEEIQTLVAKDVKQKHHHQMDEIANRVHQFQPPRKMSNQIIPHSSSIHPSPIEAIEANLQQESTQHQTTNAIQSSRIESIVRNDATKYSTNEFEPIDRTKLFGSIENPDKSITIGSIFDSKPTKLSSNTIPSIPYESYFRLTDRFNSRPKMPVSKLSFYENI